MRLGARKGLELEPAQGKVLPQRDHVDVGVFTGSDRSQKHELAGGEGSVDDGHRRTIETVDVVDDEDQAICPVRPGDELVEEGLLVPRRNGPCASQWGEGCKWNR